MPLLFWLHDGALWQEVSDAHAVALLHVAVDVSGCLHGDAAACYRLGGGRALKDVDKHGVYHVSNIHQSNIPLLVACACTLSYSAGRTSKLMSS